MRATEEIIAAIPQDDTNDNMLEIALLEGEGGDESIELRSLTWADGLGWYRQRTLTLDTSCTEALLKSLDKLQKKRTQSLPRRRADNILTFPSRWTPGKDRKSSGGVRVRP